jgi:hypothetical protein
LALHSGALLKRARRCFHKRFYELWFVAQFVVNFDCIELEKNADHKRRYNCDHPHVNLEPLFGSILSTAKPALKPVVSLRGRALHGRAEASQRVQNSFLLFRCKNLCSRCDVLKFYARFDRRQIHPVQRCDQSSRLFR